MDNLRPIEKLKPKIINISSYQLNDSEISILSKGPKFAVTPTDSKILDLQINVNEFIRKFQLKNLFGLDTSGETADPMNECLVKKKGDYIPGQARDSFLQSVINRMKNWSDNLNDLPKRNDYTSNISYDESRALKRLRNNPNLMISKVDKGGSLVIMDKLYYKNKIDDHLADLGSYERLPNYNESQIMKKVEKFAENWKNTLKQKERLYITKFDKKTANFFGLPKIHKSVKIKQVTENSESETGVVDIPQELVDLDFRFITGGWASATCKLSDLCDELLKLFLAYIPAYLRDTPDFLNKFYEIIGSLDLDDIVLVTADISKMYPNIKLALGLFAVNYWLNRHPELLHKRFPKKFVLDALTIVMENSICTFNDEFFKLKDGTATGTTVAPTYANLVMGFLETNLYNLVKEKFGVEAYNFVKKSWLRFLDDGFIVWKKSLGPVSEFIELLNSLDEHLQFTHEASEETVSFLDVTIYKDNGTLHTDVFYKPTDSHDYLPFNSYHPRHVKENIPYTLARRIQTIVSDPLRREYRFLELTRWLRRAEYPEEPIFRAYNSLRGVDPKTLRTKKPKSEKEQLIFVQSNNPNNPTIFPKILAFIDYLKTEPKYEKLFEKISVIKSETQPPNLERTLKKSYFGTRMFDYGSHQCGVCSTCKFIEVRNNVFFEHANPPSLMDFDIMHNFNCDSGYLVYKLTCLQCLEYYIGHTTCLRERVQRHKLCVLNKDYREQYVYKHIFECAGHRDIPFKVTPFFKVKGSSLTALKTTEDYFINALNPLLNSA